jgi:hypothetical protein
LNRYEFLKGLHRAYRPRTYLEIGVNDGRSLALSRTRTIAVDPAFKVTAPLHCELELVKATSDDFFARPRPMRSLRRGVVDLAFIDGMHLFEYALRDIFHTERHTRWTSVMVLDDMLPRSVDEAARDRHTDAWTGDVFKVAATLAEYRPDLLCVAVDTAPTGQLVIFGADSRSTVLSDAYDRIHAQYVVPDPQQVPEDVLTRRHAVDPKAFLAADFWHELTHARDRVFGRSGGFEQLRPKIEAAVRDASRAPVPVPG